MQTATANITKPSAPNISTDRIIEAIGQFTTAQNSAIIPTAAEKDGGRPIRLPTNEPRVAPINIVGMISPPL